MRKLIPVLLALSTTPVSAAINWQFSSGTNCSPTPTCYSSNYGNTRAVTASGITATAQSWANTGGTNTSSNAAAQTLQTGYLAVYGSSGLGVANRDWNSADLDTKEGESPEHSMDGNQRYDSIMFSFSDAVKLTSATIGWMTTDSDISVLAYTGVGAPSIAGLTYSQLTSNGWSVVGNYANLVAGTAKAINAGGITSSYWLIGAYNTAFASSADLANSSLGIGNDYMKLVKVTGDAAPPPPPPAVPEPYTGLLIGVGLIGMIASRRKAKRS